MLYRNFKKLIIKTTHDESLLYIEFSDEQFRLTILKTRSCMAVQLKRKIRTHKVSNWKESQAVNINASEFITPARIFYQAIKLMNNYLLTVEPHCDQYKANTKKMQ